MPNVDRVGGFIQDIDSGSGVREYYRVQNIVGYSIGNPTKVIASDLGGGVIQFIADGTGSAPIEPIDTANPYRVFFQKQDINLFYFTIGGAKSTNSQVDRYYSFDLMNVELIYIMTHIMCFIMHRIPMEIRTPDYLDADSDGDGCNDADEAYANANADADNNGYYGTGTPAVDADGLVTAAGISGNDYNTQPSAIAAGYTYLQGITTTIDVAPTNQIALVNETATFNATASTAVIVTDPITTASTNVTYQWQISTDGGTIFTNISGASGTVASGTDVSYTTPNLVSSDNGNIYKVIFLNGANICSEEVIANLTVNGVTGTVDITDTSHSGRHFRCHGNGQ